MSYSNRPSRRPDPTVSPSTYHHATGKNHPRDPFTPTAYQQAKREKAAAARKANRKVRP